MCFSFEKRAELAQLIGERAENLAFWTCAMERPTWRAMVLANEGLARGETPVGVSSPRKPHTPLISGDCRGFSLRDCLRVSLGGYVCREMHVAG